MHYIKKIIFENIKNKVIIGVKFQSIKNFFDRKSQINLLFKVVLILATAVVGIFSLSEYLMDFITISQNGIEFQYVLRAFSVVSILILAAFLSVNFEGLFFKKLSVSYLVYLLISYFLLMTQNLNNEHFKFFAFDTNNFFEVRSIGLIFIIVLVALLLKYSATKIELIE